MGTSTNPGLGEHWAKLVLKLPLPVRLALAAWLLVSAAVSIGAPSLVEGFSPLPRFIILLPAAILSLGASLFVLWSGCKTLFRVSQGISRAVPEPAGDPRPIHGFIGGIGAINIYLLAYGLVVFGSLELSGGRGPSIALSGLLSTGLALVLFRRGPHPRDVRIFLWGSLGLTLFFGLLFLFVMLPR